MNWLRNFMMGRYGTDKLNISLLILSMILTFISSIADIKILYILSYVPLGICIFRILSRDIAKRTRENNIFMAYYNSFINWFSKKRNTAADLKTHKYFKCPACGQKVRVPKGKGKINITCPKCNTKFIKNT